MDIHDLTRSLHTLNDKKIVMLVADGLGGLPHTPDGQDGTRNGAHSPPGRSGPNRDPGGQHSGVARHRAG